MMKKRNDVEVDQSETDRMDRNQSCGNICKRYTVDKPVPYKLHVFDTSLLRRRGDERVQEKPSVPE